MARSHLPPLNLPPRLLKAIKSLKRKKHLLILPADKGRASVVMNKETYDRKMTSMLSDTNTYERLKRDPVLSIERKLNSFLLELKKRGSLNQQLYNRLRSSGGLTPCVYGLPKIHKRDVPLRPIVSFYSSPTYKLSRHLSQILSSLVGNSESHIKNSTDFKTFITSRKLKPTEVLVSFDVVSLFTNVPVSLALDVAKRRLQSDSGLTSRTNLSINEILHLLEFCLHATYLSFRGEVYRQAFGTAMGSPVSVTVANLVMEDVEERALSSLDPPLPFWKRYVDDTCTAVPADRIDELMDHLNGVEKSIQFTVELECDGKLPFLDLLLSHESDGSITTAVYRKSTHTGRYLDFESHHPLSHKKSVVNTLLSRARSHSSSTSTATFELNHVIGALKSNGYPKAFLCKQLANNNREQLCPQEPSKWKSTAVLPYVRGLSESIRRVLTRLDIRVCFKPSTSLRRLFSSPKDRPPDMDLSSVVYKIPCAKCSACYIGQTKRRLSQRIAEHKRAVRQADFNSSALAEHMWNMDHPIDWENVEVLSNPPDDMARITSEALLIRTTPDTLNRDSGTLPTEYENLIPHFSSV